MTFKASFQKIGREEFDDWLNGSRYLYFTFRNELQESFAKNGHDFEVFLNDIIITSDGVELGSLNEYECTIDFDMVQKLK